MIIAEREEERDRERQRDGRERKTEREKERERERDIIPIEGRAREHGRMRDYLCDEWIQLNHAYLHTVVSIAEAVAGITQT